jgi:hypothetical protein
MSNAALPCRGSVDFAKPTYSRQGNRDGVIGATISNADRTTRKRGMSWRVNPQQKVAKKKPASTEVASSETATYSVLQAGQRRGLSAQLFRPSTCAGPLTRNAAIGNSRVSCFLLYKTLIFRPKILLSSHGLIPRKQNCRESRSKKQVLSFCTCEKKIFPKL